MGAQAASDALRGMRLTQRRHDGRIRRVTCGELFPLERIIYEGFFCAD